MNRLLLSVSVISLALAATACVPSPKSGAGFRLPDGDPVLGQQVFLDMQCHACHTIPGVELPDLNLEAPVSVSLGGPVSVVKTYGNLVTSIINPSHRLMGRYPRDEISVDGESFMPVMNDYMTVRQLIDLVAYLQDQYDVIPPETYPYGTYGY